MAELSAGPSSDWVRAGSWCVTFTRGITPDDVLARYGALPADARIMPKPEAVELGAAAYRAGTPKSVLRVGSLSDWSFCYEEWGVLGGMPGPLARLSSGTETLTVDSNGVGLDTFGHWRDGRCTEVYEPEDPGTPLSSPHPLWDAFQERRHTAEEGESALMSAVRVIGDRMGAVLDDVTLDAPLPTVLLGDDVPPRRSSPAGRGRGAPVPLADEPD